MHDYLSCKIIFPFPLSPWQKFMSNKVYSFLEAQRQHWPEAYDAATLPLRISLFHAQIAQHSRAIEIISANGLSLGEFDVLATLRRSPPPHTLTPSDIQKSMLITSGGLTKVLIELEHRGLISRMTKKDDRRVKPVNLSDAAMPLLDKTTRELDAVLTAWIRERLSRYEIAQITALLTKLSD